MLDIGVAASSTVLSAIGHLDGPDAAELTALGVMALGGPGVADLVIDLSAALLLDASRGVCSLIDLSNAADAADIGLHIFGASPAVARGLVTAGLCHLLTHDISAWRARVPAS